MEKRTIVLQGGEDVKQRTNEMLFRSTVQLSKKRAVLVIPWTTDSEEKEKEYIEILRDYFTAVGFREIIFLKKQFSDGEIEQSFSKADVLYLPGGNTQILHAEIARRSIQERIGKFKGTIIGNSAGAIVLSKGTVDDEGFQPGFGIVDFYVTVHFKMETSYGIDRTMFPMINIPEGAWVAVYG